jgi:hypothetical protein
LPLDGPLCLDLLFDHRPPYCNRRSDCPAPQSSARFHIMSTSLDLTPSGAARFIFPPSPQLISTPGKKIPPKERKVALLGSRAVGAPPTFLAGLPPLTARLECAREKLARRPIRRQPLCRVVLRPLACSPRPSPRLILRTQPTIESSFNKKIKLKGQDFSLEIHDTAGQVRPSSFRFPFQNRAPRQDEFSILQSKQAVGLHGWILVYSVTSRSSFEMISIIRDKILDYTGIDSVPLVVVGNKSDLDGQRCVPPSLCLGSP